MRICRGIIFLVLLCGSLAQVVPAQPARTILAVGAHAGDVELTSGAVLIRQRQLGDRVVILHMTLGERGHPGTPPADYAVQKRREAEQAAEIIGAEVHFAPYRDGEIPDDEEARRFVAGFIREIRPTHVITHWKESMHRDHAATHRIVEDAVLLASLQDVGLPEAPLRGLRGIYYAENWEDADGFKPYVYVDVRDAEDTWRDAVMSYEFVSGTFSSFHYLEYYQALHILRGAEGRKGRAVAFDIAPFGKKRILDALP